MVLVQVTSRPRESDSSDYGLTDGRCARCGLCGACKLMLTLCCYFVVCFVVVVSQISSLSNSEEDRSVYLLEQSVF